MNSPQGFVAHETFKGFDAQGELSQGERAFGSYAARAQAVEVFGDAVFRAVDDAQVFGAATFQGGLHDAVFAPGDEIERFDDHAFAAVPGQLLPPLDTFCEAGRVGHVYYFVGCGEQQLLVGSAQFRQGIHVPGMVFVGMYLTLRCQDVERGKFEIGNGIDGPAILVVGGNVLSCQRSAMTVMLKQRTCINASFNSLFQHSYGLVQRDVRGSAHGGILLEQQRLGLY